MPFITYSIKSELLDNPEKLNVKNFRKFLNDLEELNISNKSILIENEKLNILNKIAKKISELSESLISNKIDEIKELLENACRILQDSNYCKLSDKEIEKIKIDFIKKQENELDRNFKLETISGAYIPEDFDNKVEKFQNKFLNKIETYILSKSQSTEDKIDTLYIYHKELSNFLMPEVFPILEQPIKKYKFSLDTSIRTQKEKLKNLNKIEYANNIFLKWLSNMPENIRPKYKILTDIPRALKKEARLKKQIISSELIKAIQEKFEEFLSEDFDKNKSKPEVKLIWQRDLPGHLGWKHKRHWIFCKKILRKENWEKINFFAIKNDFGIEIVDEIDNLKLNEFMELFVVSKKNTKQITDIKKNLAQDTN